MSCIAQCANFENDALWMERNAAGVEISSLPVTRYLPRGAFQPVFVTIACPAAAGFRLGLDRRFSIEPIRARSPVPGSVAGSGLVAGSGSVTTAKVGCADRVARGDS